MTAYRKDSVYDILNLKILRNNEFLNEKRNSDTIPLQHSHFAPIPLVTLLLAVLMTTDISRNWSATQDAKQWNMISYPQRTSILHLKEKIPLKRSCEGFAQYFFLNATSEKLCKSQKFQQIKNTIWFMGIVFIE